MICDMRKLLLFGNNSEKSKLMKILHKEGCVEISLAQKLDNTSYVFDESKIEDINRKLTKIEFLFDFLLEGEKIAAKYAKDNKQKYKPVKTSGLLIPKQCLTFEEFASSLEVEDNVFSTIKNFEEISNKIISLRADNAKCDNILKQVEVFRKVPTKFSNFKDTKNVSIFLGTVSASKLSMVSKLEEKGAYVEVFNDTLPLNAISIVVLKDHLDEVQSILSDMDFVKCSMYIEDVASNMIVNAEETIKANSKKIEELYLEAMKDEKIIFDAQRLYDYYLLEKRKIECEGLTASTSTSFLLEAWIPQEKAEQLDKVLNDSPLSLAYIIREPIDGESVPTYCENNEVVSPYESVTNMFSAPKYKEIDPNPFVAFFFFLFFGMMLSDAGYGLILTLGAGAILAITKPKKGQSNLIKIVFMGGISTMLWGIVFGSYFGISATDMGIWCWFNPVEKPLNMLFLSVGMGIFQMLFGTGIKSVAEFKSKNYLGGIAALCWFFLVFGIAGFAGAKMLNMPSWLGTIGLVLVIVGLVLLMLGGALGKKGAGRITGALGALYEIINFFSDLMSYTRIFGLGLATAVIGMVFNNIGLVIYDMAGGVIGVIGLVLIAIIGHVFSMAINALGSYVHDSRLQFVEFFGKFYEGGGELFRPLGSEMKYYYINDNKYIENKKINTEKTQEVL